MKELLFHKRKLGYTQSTKRSPLEFQPEWAQGKAWIWSGCGDADVKRGSVLGREPKCRFFRDLIHVTSASGSEMYGPAVCCKGKPLSGGRLVLRQCIRPFCGAFDNAPDHHGYARAFDLISGQTPMGYSNLQYSIAPVRPVLHCVGLHSRRPRQERDVRRAYGSLRDISLFG